MSGQQDAGAGQSPDEEAMHWMAAWAVLSEAVHRASSNDPLERGVVMHIPAAVGDRLVVHVTNTPPPPEEVTVVLSQAVPMHDLVGRFVLSEDSYGNRATWTLIGDDVEVCVFISRADPWGEGWPTLVTAYSLKGAHEVIQELHDDRFRAVVRWRAPYSPQEQEFDEMDRDEFHPSPEDAEAMCGGIVIVPDDE